MHYTPFVGEHYHGGYQSNLKLLLLGDSHYGDAWDSTATQDVVARFMQGKDFAFFAGVQRVVSGRRPEDNDNRQRFWSRVAFSNLIQEPMDTGSTAPTKEQWAEAWKSFPDIIRATEPDLIFILTKRGNQFESQFESPFTGSNLPDLHPVGRPKETAYLREFGVIRRDYHCLSAAFDHPSFIQRSGEWDFWNQWAQRLLTEAPGILAGK